MEWPILSALADSAGGTVSVLSLALLLLRSILKEISARQARADAAFAEFRQETLLQQQAIIQALNEQKVRLARIEVLIRDSSQAQSEDIPMSREWVL